MSYQPTIPETPPVILPRAEHSISRQQIDPDTLKVLYRLHRSGFKAYLVGGGVRDLLLGRTPKDFDVGTDATPNQVKKLFRNCFLVGRRFRLAHVRFGDKVVEVATFRRLAEADDLPENPEDHRLFSENIFGTPQQDAFRRDFTINALFYDIADFSIVDFVGGLEDLALQRLRVIGDPLVRFTEDPVRMLRALEFAARLGFSLDAATREAIYTRGPLIAEAAPARIREELMELFRHRVAGSVLRSAGSMGLLPHLLAGFEGDEETFDLLERLDARTAAGTPVNESFALAALYLPRFSRALPTEKDVTITDIVQIAGLILAPHCGYFHLSHGIRHHARELLLGFFRLRRGRGQRGERRFLQHPMTSEALDLFTLWCEITGSDRQLITVWQEAMAGGGEPSEPAAAPPKRRRRRRGKRRAAPSAAPSDSAPT
ncbi:MAG: polynucleotide adenylyltransferase PcnB [Desulfuromonadales bacterium]|nr:polynucleotide adenylyltransferase PcnB [Desulfuromonadales bacterium]